MKRYNLKELHFSPRKIVSFQEYEEYKDNFITMKALLCNSCVDLFFDLQQYWFDNNPRTDEIVKTLLDMNIRGEQIVSALEYFDYDFKLFERVILNGSVKEKEDLVLTVNIMEMINYLDDVIDNRYKAHLSGALNVTEKELFISKDELLYLENEYYSECSDFPPKYDPSKY